MYNFGDETRALVELVRRLVKDHQAALETRQLRGERLKKADYEPGRDAAQKAGLWGLTLPAELGGAQLSLVDSLAITEKITKA